MREASRIKYRRYVRVTKSELEDPLITYDPSGDDGDRWILGGTYILDHGLYRFTIPKDFTFDLASIPRGLWVVIAPFELSIVAPLIHDALYRDGGDLPDGWVRPREVFTRKETDTIFKQLMKREGISWWKRWTAYAAVRIFGKSSWRG